MRPPAGFRFLRPSALWRFDRFPSYHEIRETRTAWFDADRPPALPLFVSHRWLATHAPDPEGQQLRAVQALLHAIAQVANAVRQEPEKRAHILPTPYVHGGLQAFAIVGAAHGPTDEESEWLRWAQCWNRMLDQPVERMGERMVEEIGIWYDYACMPTSTSTSGDGRHSPEVRDSLYRMNELVAACPVLILRSDGDGYDGRGWCAAELSVGREHHKHIVLRTDRIGQRIRRQTLVADGNPFESWLGTGRLLEVLDRWDARDPDLVEGHFYRIHLDYEELAQRETGRPTPLFTTQRRPEIFAGHRIFLSTMMDRLDQLSTTDSRRGRLPEIDLAAIIRDAMAAAGLHCTVPEDIVFVGCAILHARSVRAPELADFYHEAQRRWINGQSLKLVHYREKRRPLYVSTWRMILFGRQPLARVWYLFADEPADTRPRPKWARQKWLSRLLGLLESTFRRSTS